MVEWLLSHHYVDTDPQDSSDDGCKMGCYLRIQGRDLDVSQCLAHGRGLTISSYRKGEPRNAVSRVLNEESGVVIEITPSIDVGLDSLMLSAADFLDTHSFELRNMLMCKGIERAFVDFAIWVEQPAAHYLQVSSEIIALAAKLEIAVVFSVLPK